MAAVAMAAVSPVTRIAPPPRLPWAPDALSLARVVAMLRAASRGCSSAQGDIYRQLEAFAANREFNNYLAFILARGCLVEGAPTAEQPPGPQEAEVVRQAAGLLLKNNIRVMFLALHPQMQAFVATELLRAIGDESPAVRATVAACITAVIVAKRGLQGMPDLCPTLVRCMDAGKSDMVDGALTVLACLAEEAPDLLAEDPAHPLDLVVPKLIAFCAHPAERVRAKSLQILNHFLLVMPPALQSSIDSYCQALFRLANDASLLVRKPVCTAICLLLGTKPEALAPQMRNIIEYMLRSSTDSDEQVAVEACGFWAAFAEMDGAKETLREYLPRIVPILLNNMVYSEADRAVFDSVDEHDDMVPDRPEDVRPRFHQPRIRDVTSSGGPRGVGLPALVTATGSSSRPTQSTSSTVSPPSSFADAPGTAAAGIATATSHSPPDGLSPTGTTLLEPRAGVISAISSSELNNNGAVTDNAKDGNGRSNGGIGAVEDDDDDDDSSVGWNDGDEETEWNVRKCSAAALDFLASVFGDELLQMLLPRLQEKLTDSNQWEQRECGVLALGAIAEGCYSGMVRHMPTIFPYLIHLLADKHYMVRSITCWTLSRYTKWVIHERDDKLFQQMLAALLEHVLDRSKIVQKASCSAFASFEEEAGPALSSYLPHILRSLTYAFDRYQQNNLIVLYDVVCTLADAVGTELAAPDHVSVLMPPLINKWNSLSDTDHAMLPLLECLAYVFRALGMRSQQFAPNIFARCVNIVDAVYVREAAGARDDIHIEFLTCSLDLMCGLAEAVGPSIDPLVANSSNGAKPFLPLLFVAMKDGRQEVRQSAFALLGEFARARLPSLIPALPEYINCLVSALNPEYMSVSNNATWALGEVVMMAGFLPPSVPLDRQAIQRPLLNGALDLLVRVVNIPQLNKSLLENTAITLGRMGLVMPEAMAQRLGSFAEPVFLVVRNIRDDAEKEQAFHGMNAMIKQNPAAIFGCFAYYVDAIASWYHCKPDLEAEFASILSGYKQSMGDQWYALFRSFAPALQRLLQERFKI